MQGTTAIHTIEGFEPEMTTLDSLDDEMQAKIQRREARLQPKAEAEAEPPAAAPVDPWPAFQPAALQKEERALKIRERTEAKARVEAQASEAALAADLWGVPLDGEVRRLVDVWDEHFNSEEAWNAELGEDSPEW